MSAVPGLDGTSWTAVVFSLGSFLVVALCVVLFFACCRACRKERHRQVGEHVISEAVAHPPLDKPPSYWRFFRTLSSLKLSQPLEVPDGSACVAEAVPGTPPPKYDDLGFLFEILPGGKYAKESTPTVNQDDSDQGIFFATRTSPTLRYVQSNTPTVNQDDSDQGIFFATRTSPTLRHVQSNTPTVNQDYSDQGIFFANRTSHTLRHVQSNIMLSHLTENPSTSEPSSNRTSPTQDIQNNVWPTLDTGDIPKNAENPTMCLERSFRKLLANNVASASSPAQAMPAEEAEVYITKL